MIPEDDNPYTPNIVLDHIKLSDANQFYMDIAKMNPVNLVLMLLHYPKLLTQWDSYFGEGKFLAKLAKLLIAKCPHLLFIFMHSLPALHKQEQLFSLNSFYSAAALYQQKRNVNTSSPHHAVWLKSHDCNVFIKHHIRTYYK